MATDFRISGTSTNVRSECDIRVNPNDTTKIIAASNDITAGVQAQFASTDGGTTWTQTSLALQTADSTHSDPAVDWTSDGTAWAITIGIDASSTVLKLRAYKSTDNGANWTFDSTPSGTQTNVDREIMWVDHSATSPYKDQIYVTWHTGAPVQFARRTTGTSAAWQTPVQVSSTETTTMGIGGDVKSNANGDVFVFWQDADGSQGIYMAKSTDGGATFGSPVTIATTFANTRKLAIPADNGRKSRVLVSAAVYRTATKDLAYVVWPDLSGESGCTTGAGPGSSTSSSCKTRIWFARSTDGGTTWSTPTMINNQSGKNDQAFSKLSIDETDGKLVVVYYDTVNDPNRLQTQLFMQTSTDDGVTWSSATQVSSGQTDETTSSADSGNQYGDYIGLSGHAGTFYPAWTDRRSGANEEIWAAKIALVQKAVSFVVERSTLGQDEIDARRGHPGGATVPDAFRVTVDGFTAAELGLSSTADTVAIASPVNGLTITCTGNTPSLGAYGPAVQRFTFHYTLDFGPDDTAFNFTDPTKTFTVGVMIGGIGAAADIELIKQPNPFILHGDPPWLSIDLRVFPIIAGATKFGVQMGADATQAPAFIQGVMAALTGGSGTVGSESFDALDATENGSALTLLPTDNSGNRVFNFALARVRYIGLIGATDVRLFFRLFQAQTTSAAYDQSTTYRRAPSNPHGHPIPLAGIRNNEYVTIPFFAEARVDSTSVGMDQQTDDPWNVQTFTATSGGDEVDRFFGCWLDVNQPKKPNGNPNNVLPATVPGTNKDGPFNDAANPPLSIQQAIVRNLHQCLIAEIAFDPVAIPAGKDPGNWDKLAQRNLAWSAVPNPGVDGSRRALDTFEVRATPAFLPPQLLPDELMIDWGDLPAGSTASIFLPATDADEIVRVATARYTNHLLTASDGHTIDCPASGITYIPIPPGTDIHYAGLLSVDLPTNIHKGQEFSVLVRQVTNTVGLFHRGSKVAGTIARVLERVGSMPGPDVASLLGDASSFASSTHQEERYFVYRKILGAFQLTIPVHTKEALLLTEERNLSVLRWVDEAILTGNRWKPVFGRYLRYIGGRVTGFGGEPGSITPSPTGGGVPSHGGHVGGGHGAEREASVGKIAGLLYDRYGDFFGFSLDTEHGETVFHSREHQVEHLAQRAWAERILIRVVAERRAPRHPVEIVLLSLPIDHRHHPDHPDRS